MEAIHDEEFNDIALIAAGIATLKIFPRAQQFDQRVPTEARLQRQVEQQVSVDVQ